MQFDLPTTLAAIAPLTSLFATAAFGGLAGQYFADWKATGRAKKVTERLTGAVRADVARVRGISAHNARTASSGPDHTIPHAFIRFPTQSYELLIFSGQSAELASGALLDALMAYLQHAYHVNAMIDMFERLTIAVVNSAITSGLQTRQNYLTAISQYSTNEVPSSLSTLETALQESR